MRIIARLDIKSENLIKGIQFEGLRVIGNPNKIAKSYYIDGVDEIFLVYFGSISFPDHFLSVLITLSLVFF